MDVLVAKDHTWFYFSVLDVFSRDMSIWQQNVDDWLKLAGGSIRRRLWLFVIDNHTVLDDRG